MTALVLALVAGACAAVVSWMVNALRHPRWLTTRRAVVAIGAVTAVAAVVAVTQTTSDPNARREAEERLVGSLDPGTRYDRIRQQLGGAEPDRTVETRAGFVAQFAREWE
ncbi:hypothetical protein O7635_32365 [Asanoa sp. WMMD1127]|uniref:hypothetical protein n=1 Tax=Asanoa sp. WMMD1127 TaxID=3016107 RepID=UPI00241765ED|nr:hypothetical protein [Asanoa sp. WMMD1127]MDG4826569.1 hypothetical protein [Asanoa sp. WMMD1127]